jgi:hypothetical protein
VRIGIDFDNTVVSYDGVFHRAALDRGLIPPDLPTHKDSVRDFLRSAGREEAWTELQGYIYGLRMDLAQPYPGVAAFLAAAEARAVEVVLISHKTRHPYRGERHDLHAAARAFLADNGLAGEGGGGRLPWHRVLFEESLAGKLGRIHSADCTAFVDDLPEFLGHPEFPGGISRILFDPHQQFAAERRFTRATSWPEIARLLLAAEPPRRG